MTAYKVNIEKRVLKDLKKLKQSKLKDKFNELTGTLKNDPYHFSDSFEKLNPKHLNIYSRRINRQHRLVYHVDEENKIVTIYSAWGHYE